MTQNPLISFQFSSSIRGALGSFLIMFMNFGILLGFISGTFLSYFAVPLVSVTIPVLFLISVAILPDTPYSLIRRNKLPEAEKSIVFYRTSQLKEKCMPELVKLEFENLKRSIENMNASRTKLEFSDFSKCLQKFTKSIQLTVKNTFQLTNKRKRVFS